MQIQRKSYLYNFTYKHLKKYKFKCFPIVFLVQFKLVKISLFYYATENAYINK